MAVVVLNYIVSFNQVKTRMPYVIAELIPNNKKTKALFFLLFAIVTNAKLNNDNVRIINIAVVIKNALDISVISTNPNVLTSNIKFNTYYGSGIHMDYQMTNLRTRVKIYFNQHGGKSGMEFFDVFDDEFNAIGQASRLDTHTLGLWHHTFQCWIYRIVNNEKYWIVQRRHPNKEAFPNKLDKSSAGHLMAGESVADGVREIEEELGLIVPFESLISCGSVKQQHIEPHWKDKEVCHLFILHEQQELNKYTLQKEEVTGIFQVPVNDFFRLMDEAIPKIQVSGLQWNDKTNQYDEVIFYANKEDFTPQSDEYFIRLKLAMTNL